MTEPQRVVPESATVAVIGTGAMGPGIAQVFALGGYDAVMVGRSEESLARGAQQFDKYWALFRDNDLAGEEEIERARNRISTTTDLEAACREANVVVEAIIEDLEVKRDLFRRISVVAPADALLASTTSALSATAIAEAVEGPHRYINTHFAQPAQLVLVVEVVPGEKTSDETLETTLALLRDIGRVPVVSTDTPGFIWSRLQAAVLREVVAMVAEGVASVEDIDTVIKLGYASRLPAMGAFEHADLGGLDLIQEIMHTIWPHLDNSSSPDDGPIGELVRQGNLGMKSGKGFYDWTERDPDEFRRERDEEIIRRLKILQDAGAI